MSSVIVWWHCVLLCGRVCLAPPRLKYDGKYDISHGVGRESGGGTEIMSVGWESASSEGSGSTRFSASSRALCYFALFLSNDPLLFSSLEMALCPPLPPGLTKLAHTGWVTVMDSLKHPSTCANGWARVVVLFNLFLFCLNRRKLMK